MSRYSIFAFVVLFGIVGTAETEQVLTFARWKAQQVVDAKNRLARTYNKLTVARTQNAKDTEIDSLEMELRIAQQSVEAIPGLTFEDYLTVYLSRFSSHPEVLREVIKGLKSDEILHLLEAYFKLPRTVEDTAEKPTAYFMGFKSASAKDL